MDGLLFDTESLYRKGWTLAAADFGQEDCEEFKDAVCGTSGKIMEGVVHKYYPEVDVNAFIDYCLNFVHESLKVEVPQKDGVKDILEYGRRHNLKMAVASSSPKELIERNLKMTGLTDYFDALVSGQEVAKGKPEPDIFLLAASQLGLDPTDCYVFEDGFNGIHAGHRAGCKVIMIPDQNLPTEEIKKLCHGIFRNLSFAAEYLELKG